MTVPICTLQLFPTMLGLQVWRAVVMVSARAATVAAGPASRSRAVRPRQAPPIIVAYRKVFKIKTCLQQRRELKK